MLLGFFGVEMFTLAVRRDESLSCKVDDMCKTPVIKYMSERYMEAMNTYQI